MMKKWLTAVVAAVLLCSVLAPAASAAEERADFPTAVENQAYAVLENWKKDRENQGVIERDVLFPANLPAHVSTKYLESAAETFEKYLADEIHMGNDYADAISSLHLRGVGQDNRMQIYEAATALYRGSNLALFAMIGVIGAAAVIVMIPVSVVLLPSMAAQLSLDNLVELEMDAR